MPEENTNLITFGDEVVATSEITLAGLHWVEGTSLCRPPSFTFRATDRGASFGRRKFILSILSNTPITQRIRSVPTSPISGGRAYDTWP